MRLFLLFLFFVAFSLSGSAASAAIYQWVDKDGTVHFTDTPPPSAAKAKVVTPEQNNLEGYGGSPGQGGRNANLSPTVKPSVSEVDLPIVELFVTSWCGYCKKAEAYFNKRNIPFVKYDIEKDLKAAQRKKSLSRSRGVPFVLIGDVGIPGYSEAAFDKALRQYQ